MLHTLTILPNLLHLLALPSVVALSSNALYVSCRCCKASNGVLGIGGSASDAVGSLCPPGVTTSITGVCTFCCLGGGTAGTSIV